MLEFKDGRLKPTRGELRERAFKVMKEYGSPITAAELAGLMDIKDMQSIYDCIGTLLQNGDIVSPRTEPRVVYQNNLGNVPRNIKIYEIAADRIHAATAASISQRRKERVKTMIKQAEVLHAPAAKSPARPSYKTKMWHPWSPQEIETLTAIINDLTASGVMSITYRQLGHSAGGRLPMRSDGSLYAQAKALGLLPQFDKNYIPKKRGKRNYRTPHEPMRPGLLQRIWRTVIFNPKA